MSDRRGVRFFDFEIGYFSNQPHVALIKKCLQTFLNSILQVRNDTDVSNTSTFDLYLMVM